MKRLSLPVSPEHAQEERVQITGMAWTNDMSTIKTKSEVPLMSSG